MTHSHRNFGQKADRLTVLLLMKKTFVLRQPEKKRERSSCARAVTERSAAVLGKQPGRQSEANKAQEG